MRVIVQNSGRLWSLAAIARALGQKSNNCVTRKSAVALDQSGVVGVNYISTQIMEESNAYL
jgi:hypothetical protein